jgi:hypothetical protein
VLAADPDFEDSEALGVLVGMLNRVAEISGRAWSQAEMRGDPD